LIHALYALKGKMIDKKQLADLAVYIEQEIIKENVGCQDQFMASFGGLNLVSFNGKKNIHVQPLVIGNERLKELSGHLMLFFTGFTRISSEIAGEQIKNYSKKRRELNTMHQMVYEAISILNSNSRISEFGKLLHEGWLIKRSLSDKVSNYKLDDIYDAGIEAGAIGGKLLGAGGGGFMLLFVSPERQSDVRNRLKDLLCVPFQFENSGSTIIFYQPDQF
jgi:D-glycero-alpha-D-manno-heptose-7-phosphate kinase